MCNNIKTDLVKNIIKRQFISIFQRALVLIWLSGILLMNSCDGHIGSIPQDTYKNEKDTEKEKEREKETTSLTHNETVVFCGNPGVGKSTLCNSIFQKPVFKSGMSFGSGMTTHEQQFLHVGRLYIDTPGLDDIEKKQQAAEEIEKALKHNHNYKIIFVAMLDQGRIKPADLATINVVCDAIKTHFKYGIIFNQVYDRLIEQINREGFDGYLRALNKQPSSILVLRKITEMDGEDNVYFRMDSENREKLLRFIWQLEANRILDSEVNKIDVSNFQEKINEIELKHKKEIADLSKKTEEQSSKLEEQVAQINKIGTQLLESHQLQQEQKQEITNLTGNLNKITSQLQQTTEELKKQKQEAKDRIKRHQEESEKRQADDLRNLKQSLDNINSQLQQSKEEVKKQKQEVEKSDVIKQVLDIAIAQNKKIDDYLNMPAKDRTYGQLKLIRAETENKIDRLERMLKEMGDPKILEKSLPLTVASSLQTVIHREIPALKINKKLLDEEYESWHKAIRSFLSVNSETAIEEYIQYVYRPDNKGNFLIHMWAENGTENEETGEFIIKRALNTDAQDNNGHTPLHIAIQKKHLKKVNMLLEGGADLNIDFPDGRYPLAYVIDEDYPNLIGFVKTLLQYRASIYTNYPRPSSSSSSILMWVIRHDKLSEISKTELVKVLLEYRASPNQAQNEGGYSKYYQDIQGWTPLYVALESGYCEIVESMLRKDMGYEPNEPKILEDGDQVYITPRYIPWKGTGLNKLNKEMLHEILDKYNIDKEWKLRR